VGGKFSRHLREILGGGVEGIGYQEWGILEIEVELGQCDMSNGDKG
jgi:hypothetical protein